MAELIDEFMNWRSQFVTSNSDRMGLRAGGKGKRHHA